MKSLAVFAILAIATFGLSAQDAPQKPATTPAPPQHAMHHEGMMNPHMGMADQAAKMRATLDKMKANLAKISDPALKQQAQYDVDLWEEMVKHMESMARMMSGHGGMGMGMKDHPPMGDQKPAAPEKK